MTRTFMRYALASLHLSILVTMVVVAILYGSVTPASLAIWTVAVTAVALTRYAVLLAYKRRLNGVSGPLLVSF